jgi:predicted  nucleic acid-binding Zn-ribbon protein
LKSESKALQAEIARLKLSEGILQDRVKELEKQLDKVAEERDALTQERDALWMRVEELENQVGLNGNNGNETVDVTGE